MPVNFDGLEVGREYARPELAELWGYKTFNAIARGVVTPRGSNTIILFITRVKQAVLHQYEDKLEGDTLAIEGETNHAADQRLLNAQSAGDEIHLFYRDHHRDNFTYHGEVKLLRHEFRGEAPTRFWFSVFSASTVARDALETEQETHGIPPNGEGNEEGAARVAKHIRYERDPDNRRRAIEIHGTVCKACGFDFDAIYGVDYARHYIEIHHIESITAGVRRVNPETDLVPLCSNCHSMAHRRKGEILSVDGLKALLARGAYRK